MGARGGTGFDPKCWPDGHRFNFNGLEQASTLCYGKELHQRSPHRPQDKNRASLPVAIRTGRPGNHTPLQETGTQCASSSKNNSEAPEPTRRQGGIILCPKLRHTKHECIVRDLIDDPYEPQPFDCLITALIARCCLPQEVWPQGLQVTWDHIVKYVPSVLRERLTEGAKSHLRKHAVYLDSHGQPGIESIGVEAANAVVPRSPQSVASPNPVTTETQAGSVKAVDVRSATQAKKQDANAISDSHAERETSATITKLPSRRRSETSASSKLDDSSIRRTFAKLGGVE
ncbi:hypothetical protein MRX96_021698 [Rhipicephalus microplus]